MDTEEMSAALKRLILSPRGARGGGQPEEWIRQSAASQPTADALVARSLLTAKPSPLTLHEAMARRLNVRAEAWDEELPRTHWPVDDETLFYAYRPRQAGPNGGKSYFDLNISLPVILPDAEIRVLNAEGENYYHKPGDVAANILFGNYAGAAQSSAENEEVAGGNEPPAAETATEPAAESQASAPHNWTVVDELPADQRPPLSVCDVWASFLRVHIGTIYNVRAEDVADISEMFLRAVEALDLKAGLELECSGIYRIKQRYETRGQLKTEADRNRFYQIRRALKVFVLQLREKYSCTFPGSNHQAPILDATILPTCRSGASLPIQIRRYSPLPHEVSGVIRGKQSIEMPDGSELPLTTSCFVDEIRLEMTHARTVDPRWMAEVNEAWILCRRMPSSSFNRPARKVLAGKERTTPLYVAPRIVYQFADPKTKLLKSRFGPLYMLTDSAMHLTLKPAAAPAPPASKVTNRDAAAAVLAAVGAVDATVGGIAPSIVSAPNGGGIGKSLLGISAATGLPIDSIAPGATPPPEQAETAEGSQLRAEAVPFFPISALSHVLQNYQSSSYQIPSSNPWDKLVESALNADLFAEPRL